MKRTCGKIESSASYPDAKCWTEKERKESRKAANNFLKASDERLMARVKFIPRVTEQVAARKAYLNTRRELRLPVGNSEVI